MHTISTKQHFQKRVLEPPTPVLAAFGAEWCGPFHMLAPILERLQEELVGQIEIVGVDIDLCPRLAETYEAQDIPTLILFKGGQVVSRIRGVVPKHIITSWLREWLGAES